MFNLFLQPFGDALAPKSPVYERLVIYLESVQEEKSLELLDSIAAARARANAALDAGEEPDRAHDGPLLDVDLDALASSKGSPTTALVAACSHGLWRAAAALLGMGACVSSVGGPTRATPLHAAATADSFECVKVGLLRASESNGCVW